MNPFNRSFESGQRAKIDWASENARVENAIRSKLQGRKMQEWKKQEKIAGVENSGVSRMEHQTEIISKES